MAITVKKDEIIITPYDTPWEVACMIINAKYIRNGFDTSFFGKDDIKRIGEHLINYCNAERETNVRTRTHKSH